MIKNPIIPAGSTILVTVRNLAKNEYWTTYFTKHYGPGCFSLVESTDLSAPSALNEALRGVAGIAHCIGPMAIDVSDVEAQVAIDAGALITFLDAAKKQESVRAFVLTSSAWAAWTPDVKRRVTLSEKSWNMEAIETAASTTLTPQEKGWAGFMALKTRFEQEAWAWVEREKPVFTFNTLLIDAVLGPCLNPRNQGIPSTAGFLKGLFYGQGVDMLAGMQPQWYIDTRDVGKLFVAALMTPGVNRERLFGFGGKYSWYQVVEIFKRLRPDRNFARIPDLGVDQTEVPNQRAEALLKGHGSWPGWMSLEDCVKGNVDSILELE